MNKKLIRKMLTAAGGPIYSTIEKSDNTKVSYNPIIEMSKRKGLIGTLAGILLLTEHNEVQEKRKLEEANKKRLKKRKELEDKVNAQKKHSLSSPSLINAANDLQYMDTPEGQELARMNREDETNESAYIASLPWWKKGMFYANKLVNAGFIPVGGGTTGMAAAKTPQQTLSGFISKFGEPGNLERTVNNIILENEHWLPKETGMFAQKHSSVGSSYRKIFEELWGKENTDRLTDDLLGKLILIRNHLINTNIPLKGDFVYVVDGQAKAYRNGLEIGYLSNSYINNGRALHPEMVKKQGTNNAGVSELLYNGTILAENRPIISGSRLLMPEVTTHIWTKYPTRKLISTEGVHAWPLRTAQERGIKLNYEKNWHTLPEFSKLHQLALDENIRTNLIGLPIYELSEPSYLPMVKNARVFDISLLRDGYINLDFTPGFAYKQGGKINAIKQFKQGGQVRKMLTASGGPIKKPIKRLKDGYRYIPDEENGGWDRISDNSMSDVFATMEFTPKKTTVGSSITRKQSAPSKTYYSAYNPDDVVKGFNALTLGGLNNLSPTQWTRRIYDTGKLLNGDMTWSGYTNSWINGNNGLVSLKFSEEHPYLSAGINLVGDAAALGGITGIKKLINISKPNVSVTANIGTAAEQGTTTLSLEEILKAFEAARQWHLNRINSPGYKDRALRAGFTEEEIPQLLQLLTNLINRLKLLRPEEVLGSNIRLNHNLNGKPSAGYWRTNLNGNLKQGISFYDTNASYDDAVSNFIHEFGHGATFGLNGTETSGYMKALADQFPLINRAVKYNRSLYPEINAGRVELAAPGAIRTGNVGYFASPTEMLSRGYEFMRDYGNNWVKAYKSGELSSKTHLDLVGSRENSNIFNTIATPKGAANFLRNALGISIPLGLGYGLYNNDNLLQQLQYLKQGGKMNVLEFLKNGSGIHIKEKNKGKFTSYCGGKVTDECILRGKNSSNPAIRKRATFAANARKWKHKEGGIIKAAAGTQVNTDTTSKKFNWNSALNTGVDFIGQMLPSILGGNSSSLQIPDTMTDTTLLYLLLLQQQTQAINDLDTVLKSLYDRENPNANGGDIVRNHYNWLLTSAKKGLDAEIEKKKKDLIDTLVANLKANTIGSLLLTGLGLVSNYIGNKKGSSVS